jgi:hypothetical protein
MKLSKTVEGYLKGESFSNGLIVDFYCQRTPVTERQEFLVRLVKEKSLIHIGFADHLPLIDKKLEDQTWLHKQLMVSSEMCLGVDINENAVSHCKEKHNIENIYYHDVTEGPLLKQITMNKWDYAILGEIVEHVGNPVEFLSRLRERYGKYIDRLIITVPNAWDLTNLIYLRHCREYINSDHRFWFTPYTISKVVYDAGYTVNEIKMVTSGIRERWINRYLRNRYPLLNDTIVVDCRMSD